MTFEDRVSAYPGRYLMTDESGGTSYVILERADEPVRPGTPLNAETFNAMIANMYPGMQSEEHPGCFYRMVDDEVEWINPPMVLNEEYRTTERYNGHPVYKKTVEFTSMPTESDKTTEEYVDLYISQHGETIPSDCTVIDVLGTLYKKDIEVTLNIPTILGEKPVAWFRVNGFYNMINPDTFTGRYIELVTTRLLSGFSAQCTVKYIKA